MGQAVSRLFSSSPDNLRLGQEIGRGAYATVYKGQLGQRIIAAKRVHRILLDYAEHSEEDLQSVQLSFREECDILRRAKHYNIVEFIGVYQIDLQPVLVMEFMDQTLHQYLKSQKGKLLLPQQLYICVQIASGLTFLHLYDPQILHRDLQPKNVLLNSNGTKVKVSDLGQAKFRPSDVIYLSTKAPGCIPYMPPEVLGSGKARFTSKGDVFSFGVLALEIATQDPPTSGLDKIGALPEIERRADDLSKLPDDHQLKPLILQCLRDNPEERPDIETVKVKLLNLLIKQSLIAEPLKKVNYSKIKYIYFQGGPRYEVCFFYNIVIYTYALL